jgi:hypothetical protein
MRCRAGGEKIAVLRKGRAKLTFVLSQKPGPPSGL